MMQLTLESLPDPVLTHIISFIPIDLELSHINKRFYKVFDSYLTQFFNDLGENYILTGIIQHIKTKHSQWSAQSKLAKVIKTITNQLIDSIYFNKDILKWPISRQLNQSKVIIWQLNLEYVVQFKQFIEKASLTPYPQKLTAPLNLAICYLSSIQSTQEKINKIQVWLKNNASLFQNLPMRELVVINPSSYIYR